MTSISFKLYLGDEATYLTDPDPNATTENHQLLRTLHSVLKKEEMCIIVRRVYIRNTAPKLYALLPAVGNDTFLGSELLYRHQIEASFTVYMTSWF